MPVKAKSRGCSKAKKASQQRPANVRAQSNEVSWRVRRLLSADQGRWHRRSSNVRRFMPEVVSSLLRRSFKKLLQHSLFKPKTICLLGVYTGALSGGRWSTAVRDSGPQRNRNGVAELSGNGQTQNIEWHGATWFQRAQRHVEDSDCKQGHQLVPEACIDTPCSKQPKLWRVQLK